ncbi:hypothetical protein D9M73_298240 [compost metagenome]
MAVFCQAPMFCGPNSKKIDSPRPMPIPAVIGPDNPTATTYSKGNNSSASISKSTTWGISQNWYSADTTSANPKPRA